MEPLGPRNVAALLAPLHEELMALLRALDAAQWMRPTVAGAWRVRDIAAHILDTQLRKLSAHRDGQTFDAADDDVLRLINRLNATGVEYARRLSTRLLTELLAVSGPEVAEFLASVEPHAPAPFSVAWAGEAQSENWMDIGRDYTEWWHHQMQIRDAVGAPPVLLDERWLEPLLDFSVRALPHAYRAVSAPDGTTITLRVGELAWTLQRESPRWRLYRGVPKEATTIIGLTPDASWRLFYNAPFARPSIDGDAALAEPLLTTRSVMV